MEDTVGVQIGNTVSDDSTKQAHINKCYHWRDADYEGIGNFLANYDWNQLFSLYPSVNEWTAFSDVMYCAIDMFVPTLNKSTHSGKRHYPKNVRKAFARKRCLCEGTVLTVVTLSCDNVILMYKAVPPCSA